VTGLSIQEFGSSLLSSGDLDPVYIALHRQKWPLAQKQRWLIAYWCYYNCGVASWLSEREGDNFWTAGMMAAVNKQPAPTGDRWPRGRERRHYRGAAAVGAWAELESCYREQPERMVELIIEQAPDFKAVTGKVMEHQLFGPWIAFKVADMLDRVLEVPVDFTEAAVFMFKDPVKAAVMYWNQKTGCPIDLDWEVGQVKRVIIPDVVAELTTYFAHTLAPPRGERMVNIQEIETILCKWKSHMHGHYPPGLDTREIREALHPWRLYSDAARTFLEAMP